MANSSHNPSSRKPHAVLFPFPVQGHINPMMLLAKTLASRGVQITLVTTEKIVSRISEARENGISLSDAGDVHLIGISDGLPDDRSRDIFGPYFGPAVDNMGGAFEAVLQDTKSVTCVIADCFVRCVRDVTRKLNIPRIVFWPQSVTAFALFYYSNKMISGGFNPFDGSVETFGPRQSLDLITCVPGVPPIHPAYLPFGASLGHRCLSRMKTLIAEQLWNLDDAIWVLGNSFQTLEPHVCEVLSKFQPIGPLLPPAFLQERKSQDTRSGTSLWKEEDCTEWLDKQPESSVLYVSFGSTGSFSIAQVREIACGLLASAQRFLWVIRPDTLVEKSITNVLDALPEGFLDQIKEKAMIINWAPQLQVLAHPSVSGFFSHCGWNSTLDSICMGVPLLGWPQLADQLTNCWLVVNEWNIGMELERNVKNETDRKKVERAVRVLMVGQAAEAMKARAVSFREAARRATEADVVAYVHWNYW